MNGSDDCARVSDLLPEFLAGRASAEDDALVRAHLEACAECRNRANAVSLLQQTPVPAPDPGRWDDFVTGVVDATEQRRRRPVPRRAMAAAAVLVLLAGGLVLWDRLPDRSAEGGGLEQLAREIAELPDEQAAAWTAGLVETGWLAVGFDTSGLTAEQLQQLVTEVERT